MNKTRSFPGADVGSDHELVLMTFKLRLKKMKKEQLSRLRFDLEKLRDPRITEQFQANIGGRFAPLLALGNNIDDVVDNFNTAMIEAASEVLGKSRPKKKAWITNDILALCHERRNLKKPAQ